MKEPKVNWVMAFPQVVTWLTSASAIHSYDSYEKIEESSTGTVG